MEAAAVSVDSSGSTTAVRAALMRALHAEDARCGVPPVFDDFLAAALVTGAERAAFEAMVIAAFSRSRTAVNAGGSPIDTAKTGRPLLYQALQTVTTQALMLTRARFVEDHLIEQIARGVSQYVIVGAGLDTFALRRADLRERLSIIEIDRPATQALKRSRLAAAGLECPPHLHFVAADLERETITDALRRSPYRCDRRAFFAWAGVSYYLSTQSCRSTLASIGRVGAPGSCLAFDCIDRDAFSPLKASARIRSVMQRVRESGEPMTSAFDPAELPEVLGEAGLRIVEALGPDEQTARYFSGRPDELRATEHFHLVLAEVSSVRADRLHG